MFGQTQTKEEARTCSWLDWVLVITCMYNTVWVHLLILCYKTTEIFYLES